MNKGENREAATQASVAYHYVLLGLPSFLGGPSRIHHRLFLRDILREIIPSNEPVRFRCPLPWRCKLTRASCLSQGSRDTQWELINNHLRSAVIFVCSVHDGLHHPFCSLIDI